MKNRKCNQPVLFGNQWKQFKGEHQKYAGELQ